MSGFVEEFGHRQKSEVLHLRGLGESCELAVLGGCKIRVGYYMDHCHRHGFVRGWLCAEHNRILNWYDSGLYLVYGFSKRLTSEDLSAIFRYLYNCRGCDALGLQQRLDLRREALRCAPVRRKNVERLIARILRSTERTSRAPKVLAQGADASV